MTESQMQAVIESRAPRNVLVANLHLLKHNENSDDEPNVYRTVDIVLDLTGNGEFYRKPSAWREYRMGSAPTPTVWFLQLMLLLVETTGQGGYSCAVDPKTHERLYNSVVVATARCLNNVGKEWDVRLRDRYVTHDYYVNLRFAYDVDYECKKLDWLAKEEIRRKRAAEQEKKKTALERKKKKPAKKKQKKKDDEAMEDDDDEPVVKKRKKIVKTNVTNPYNDWRRDQGIFDDGEFPEDCESGVIIVAAEGPFQVFEDVEEEVDDDDAAAASQVELEDDGKELLL